MLVTTATSGRNWRNDQSYSSASTTMSGPLPGAALTPVAATTAPTAYDGSAPSARNAVTSMPLVVDLPWLPATATLRRASASNPSSAARLTTGRPASRAATISGLAADAAAVITTRSAAAASVVAVC